MTLDWTYAVVEWGGWCVGVLLQAILAALLLAILVSPWQEAGK